MDRGCYLIRKLYNAAKEENDKILECIVRKNREGKGVIDILIGIKQKYIQKEGQK